ncbi:hypothetical protein ACXR0O_13015 [Verrucomicrobiota bacterium sgz303538]
MQFHSKEDCRNTNYRCHVQPVRLGPERRFQVRIGMEGDHTLDYVPAYRSAFGELLQLSVAHVNESDAELEALMLLEFIESRGHEVLHAGLS